MEWIRKAAELGDTKTCLLLAVRMYADRPYAREIGRVEGVRQGMWEGVREEAAGGSQPRLGF
jgi:TPR repeat protein